MTHLTDRQIQEHIENNCRNAHGEPMMDEQAFYEGAKWYRETVVKNNAVLPHVSGSNYCKQCKEPIPDGFRFCSGECKQYYYR